MGRRPLIPHELTKHTFTLDEARAAGLTLSSLRGRSWLRVGFKLYRWVGASDDTWHLISSWKKILPRSAVFVGRTAAWMHRLDVDPANPVEVAVSSNREVRSRTGLEVHHGDVTGECVSIRGVRATSLDRTLLDICARSPAADALVVIDMAIGARLTKVDALLRYADQAHGRPGAARLRSLVDVAAPAESPMETRLRWLLLSSGLPKPEVQADLYADDGRFIARADLVYRAANLVIEFDGGNHRDRLISDDRRQNSLVGAGYRLLRFTSADLRQRPEAVIAEVREALRSANTPKWSLAHTPSTGTSSQRSHRSTFSHQL